MLPEIEYKHHQPLRNVGCSTRLVSPLGLEPSTRGWRWRARRLGWLWGDETGGRRRLLQFGRCGQGSIRAEARATRAGPGEV